MEISDELLSTHFENNTLQNLHINNTFILSLMYLRASFGTTSEYPSIDVATDDYKFTNDMY